VSAAIPARRFGAAVPWTVEITNTAEYGGEPFLVSVMARSADKAARAARRFEPGRVVQKVTCSASEPVRAGAGLDELVLDRDYRCKVDGTTWTITLYDDGAAGISAPPARDGEPHRGASLPAHLVRTVRAGGVETVGALVRLGAEASDPFRLIALVALALEHGAVLSAPAAYASKTVQHVTAGRSVSARPGEHFSCITDPGGALVNSMHNTSTVGHYSRDESSFAAARAFIEIAGLAGAVWALRTAREVAELQAAAPETARASRATVDSAIGELLSKVAEHGFSGQAKDYVIVRPRGQ